MKNIVLEDVGDLCFSPLKQKGSMRRRGISLPAFTALAILLSIINTVHAEELSSP